MDAKKCDRCGSFYIRKESKTSNVVDIFGKEVLGILLIGCPNCGARMDLKDGDTE